MTDRLPSDIIMDKLNVVAAAAPAPLSQKLVDFFWRGWTLNSFDQAMLAGDEEAAGPLYTADQFAAFQAAIAACDYKTPFGSADAVTTWTEGGGLRGRRHEIEAA
jgi:hypothetical protein